MAGVRIAILVAIGILVVGFMGLVVFYPLGKTLGGWFEALRAWALGRGMAPMELGLTMADGGEKADKEE